MNDLLEKTMLFLVLFSLSFNCDAASVLDLLQVKLEKTTSGHEFTFGDGFFPKEDLLADDPVKELLNLNPVDTSKSNEDIYLGRASYELHVDTSVMNREFFENVEILSYLLGSSNQLQFFRQHPFELFGAKKIFLGIIVHSHQTTRVFEKADIKPNSVISGLVQKFKPNSPFPDRVVVQLFDHFDGYFDAAVILTMISKTPDRQHTHVDLVSVSNITSLPPFAEHFIRRTSLEDLKGFIDRFDQHWGR